ncbi:DUF302 domain-containing protein [Nocardia macrotermitis]|uniref:DUF302 domain-containing protein n=1 Tax=Nocardia macrotermitis TaxID=2585198 RepID=A0A7K0CV37_9NOCA|nr:DUF302 domain-containing protein [Nocardia macrotermitis]MQY17370.1 hypothetical protein [Nocardia macrotermitis]
MNTDPTLSVTLRAPFGDVVEWTRKALSQQGFGVLTEIDVQATLRAKLDADMENYLILGACNPPLAHRALESERRLGLLLPCNVVVRDADADTVLVEAADPRMMSGIIDAPAVTEVAAEATARLQAVIRSLAEK